MIIQLAVNGFDENFSYFIYDKANKELGIVDPVNISYLENELKKTGTIPKILLLTHSHFDHVEGVSELIKKYQIPVYMHKNAKDRVLVDEKFKIFVDDEDEIKLGDIKIQVLWTPGHIDDAVCYYIEEENALITGDTLFIGKCGRTDLQHSNVIDLYKSLQKLKNLPNSTIIYPGHDYGYAPFSTMKKERKANKYLLCENLENFIDLRM